MSSHDLRRDRPVEHDPPGGQALLAAPFDGESLEDLIEIRNGIERQYDGPIPDWTLRAWDRAYRQALRDAFNE